MNLLCTFCRTPLAGNHGVVAATSSDHGHFSCPISQRQRHVVNLNGARCYRHPVLPAQHHSPSGGPHRLAPGARSCEKSLNEQKHLAQRRKGAEAEKKTKQLFISNLCASASLREEEIPEIHLTAEARRRRDMKARGLFSASQRLCGNVAQGSPSSLAAFPPRCALGGSRRVTSRRGRGTTLRLGFGRPASCSLYP